MKTKENIKQKNETKLETKQSITIAKTRHGTYSDRVAIEELYDIEKDETYYELVLINHNDNWKDQGKRKKIRMSKELFIHMGENIIMFMKDGIIPPLENTKEKEDNENGTV